MNVRPLRAGVTLAITAATRGDVARARQLARKLHLPFLEAASGDRAAGQFDALLVQCGQELALQWTAPGAPGSVRVDFAGGRMRWRRRSGGRELLGRAVGVGPKAALHVLDATAGLGRDAFVLADLGCRVTLYERHPVIAALLSAGLVVASGATDERVAHAAGRMQLYTVDARSAVLDELADVDVICLDPMFPASGKGAAVKKDTALLRTLLGEAPCGDAEDLLRWSLQQAVARVVVKRPPRARALAGLRPSHSVCGRTVRYDVHVKRALTVGRPSG